MFYLLNMVIFDSNCRIAGYFPLETWNRQQGNPKSHDLSSISLFKVAMWYIPFSDTPKHHIMISHLVPIKPFYSWVKFPFSDTHTHHVGISRNLGYPEIIHFNMSLSFPLYAIQLLGYPHWWKIPCVLMPVFTGARQQSRSSTVVAASTQLGAYGGRLAAGHQSKTQEIIHWNQNWMETGW